MRNLFICALYVTPILVSSCDHYVYSPLAPVAYSSPATQMLPGPPRVGSMVMRVGEGDGRGRMVTE